MEVTAFRWNENQLSVLKTGAAGRKAGNFHSTIAKELMHEITDEMMRILINLSSLAIIYD